MNIFVANLNYQTQDDELRELFEEFGQVDSAKIIMDKFSGRSKGFAFVEMPNDEDATEAINNLNESDLHDRTIVVKKANPRNNDNRGGGRGGYGGGNRGGYGGGNRGGYDRNDRY